MPTDNGSFVAKQRIRAELRAHLGAPTVLEGFAGEGRLYRACWAGLRGATIDKNEAKARDAGRERGSSWAVYLGDTLKALGAGWMAHHPFDVVDLDAYGSPWPFLRAWLTGRRARASRTHVLLTDGYMATASISPRCVALFASPAVDRPQHIDTMRRPLRMDVPAALYLETARIRIQEWMPAGGSLLRFETVADKRMRLHSLEFAFALGSS